MKDHFGNSQTSGLLKQLTRLTESLKFGERERQIFELFFDERLKLRRGQVPLFYFYAILCDGKDELEWGSIIAGTNVAIANLRQIKYIQEVQLKYGTTLGGYVGRSGDVYELTAKGLEALQELHPPIALRLRAWIAVLPPWLVLTGTIVGGVSTGWSLFHFILQHLPKH